MVAGAPSLVSLVTVTRKVDRQVIRRAQPAAKGQTLSIEEFFTRSARYKRRLLIAEALFCFAGVALTACSVFLSRVDAVEEVDRENPNSKF